MDYVEQDQIESESVLAHWYYQAKFKLMCQALTAAGEARKNARLADVGCGIGVFLTLLERSGLFSADHLTGIDPAAPDGAKSVGGTVPILRSSPPGAHYDVALLMDVLEHVENDKAVLEQALETIVPGGHVFITVPAFPALWSRHDEVLGHYRRYTVGTLGKLIASIPELQVKRLHYFYASILPPATIVRFLRRNAKGSETDMAPCGPALNSILKTVLGLESFVAVGNRIAGLTVVALCQKKR
jgi:SAM-dependent methyltransferase